MLHHVTLSFLESPHAKDVISFLFKKEKEKKLLQNEINVTVWLGFVKTIEYLLNSLITYSCNMNKGCTRIICLYGVKGDLQTPYPYTPGDVSLSRIR